MNDWNGLPSSTFRIVALVARIFPIWANHVQCQPSYICSSSHELCDCCGSTTLERILGVFATVPCAHSHNMDIKQMHYRLTGLTCTSRHKSLLVRFARADSWGLLCFLVKKKTWKQVEAVTIAVTQYLRWKGKCLFKKTLWFLSENF